MKPAQKFVVVRPWGLRVKGQVIELMGMEADERLSMNWVKRYVPEKPKKAEAPKKAPVVEEAPAVAAETEAPVVEEATIDQVQVEAATAYQSKHNRNKRGRRK